MAVAKRADDRWSARPSGLSIVGNIPWGTHICQFYQDKQDLLDILVPYFAAGLRENEYCLWVTTDSLTIEEAWSALSRVMGDLTPYLVKGQLEIIDSSKWYSVGEKFIARRAYAVLANKVAEARLRGFAGMRIATHTFGLDQDSWQDYLQDETLIARTIREQPILAISTYDLAKCTVVDILDIAARHPYALVRRDGNWQIISNSESKRTKVAVQQSEERFRAVFHTANAGFCLIRATDGTILEVNQAWLNMVGYSLQEIIGRKITDVDIFLDQGPEVAPEVRVKRKDGQIRVHSVFSRKVAFNNYQCFLWTVQDITDLVNARQELEASVARIKVLSLENDESRLQILRFLAHEITNPLTAIKGFAQLLEMKTVSSNSEALAQKMTAEVDRLSEMLSMVFEAFKFETGRLSLNFHAVDWAEIINSAIESQLLEGLHLIEAEIPRGVMVLGDALRLEEVVRNLLSNAVNYSAPGSQVAVKLAIKDNRALLSVSDEGVGVPIDELDRIFEGFYRASNVASIGSGGIGLALHLSKHLVEEHDGRIWAESTLGGGTTMFVELPLLTAVCSE